LKVREEKVEAVEKITWAREEERRLQREELKRELQAEEEEVFLRAKDESLPHEPPTTTPLAWTGVSSGVICRE